LKKADCLLQLGQLAEAERWARRAIAVDPQEIKGYQTLAHVLAAMGKWPDAVVAAQRAVAVFPRDANSCAVLADVLARAGRPADARAWAGSAARLAPGDADLLANVAGILSRADALAEAGRLATRANELEPGRFRMTLLQLKIRQGITKEDAAILPDMAQEKEDVHLYNRLGHALLVSGDLVGAENAFRRAAEIQPDMEELQGALGEALRRQGRLNEALEVLRKLEGTRNPHILGHLAEACRDSGDLPGAEKSFRSALEVDPSLTGFRGALADVLRAQGRDEEARKIRQGITKEDAAILPDMAQENEDVHLYNHLGHALLVSGDLVGAENAFRRAAKIQPDMEELQGALGEVLRRQGRLNEALEVLRKLEGTRNPHILGHLAEAYRDSGDLAGAEKSFRSAMEMDPSLTGLRGALAEVLRAQGRDEEARTVLQYRKEAVA
jgi:tetratricopeptide (TPR) repeat protein